MGNGFTQCIRKDKRGGYTYSVTINRVGYKGACTGCTTRKQALAFVTQVKADLRNNKDPLKDKPLITIGVLGEKYKQYTIARNGDIKHVRSKVKFLNAYFGENTPAVNIKKSDLDTFINYCRTVKNYKDSTIDRYISALSKMYNIGIDDEVLEKNPCARIGKLAPYDQENYKYWEEEEMNRILDNLSGTYKDIVEVASITLLRLSNIRLMKKEWIDLNSGILRIPREFTKSKKPYIFNLPINSKLRNILIKNINYNNNTEYVFINTKRQTPFCEDKLEKVFAQACIKAKVKNYKFTGLRHTGGSRLGNSGKMGIQEVKEYMGHSTIQVTQKYMHSRKNSKLVGLNILEDLI